MTKQFGKWSSKQSIPHSVLKTAMDQVIQGHAEADLGGHLFKKRIPFPGQGKRSSGRTILCYKTETISIFIHGFAKILTRLTPSQIQTALQNGDFQEVTP